MRRSERDSGDDKRRSVADARSDDAQVVGQAGGGKPLDLRCDRRDYLGGSLPFESLDDLGEPRLAELVSVMARLGYPIGIEQNAGAPFLARRVGGHDYFRSSGMRVTGFSKMAPVTFPWPSSWNSMVDPGNAVPKRVSERGTRGPSGTGP